jgi:hypothetical protein
MLPSRESRLWDGTGWNVVLGIGGGAFVANGRVQTMDL